MRAETALHAFLGLGLAFQAGLAWGQPKPRVLWLGGGPVASHNPGAMREMLQPVFENAGLQVDYKTEESVLNPDSLGRYDVMYIYNSKKGMAVDGSPDLTRAQEDALYAWVREGHAVIAVHSANSSYLGNPRYLQLFGAAFSGHGDKEAYKYITVVNPAHPAMQGVEPPPTAGNVAYWDEGRVGRFSATDTIMLATARADGKPQPWTWVRPEGKGWVYYTSSGHDERCWKDHNFQQQLIQALKWGASLRTPTTRLPGARRRGVAMANSRPLAVSGPFRLFDVTGAVVAPILTGAGEFNSGLPSGAYPVLLLEAGKARSLSFRVR